MQLLINSLRFVIVIHDSISNGQRENNEIRKSQKKKEKLKQVRKEEHGKSRK